MLKNIFACAATQPSQPEQEAADSTDDEDAEEEPGLSQVCTKLLSMVLQQDCINAHCTHATWGSSCNLGM